MGIAMVASFLYIIVMRYVLDDSPLRLPLVIFPPSLTYSKVIVILHFIKQFVTFMFPMMQIVIPQKIMLDKYTVFYFPWDWQLSLEKMSVHKIYVKLC